MVCGILTVVPSIIHTIAKIHLISGVDRTLIYFCYLPFGMCIKEWVFMLLKCKDSFWASWEFLRLVSLHTRSMWETICDAKLVPVLQKCAQNSKFRVFWQSRIPPPPPKLNFSWTTGGLRLKVEDCCVENNRCISCGYHLVMDTAIQNCNIKLFSKRR